MQFQRNLFQVEYDVGGIFDDAGYGLKFVQHAFDFDGSNGRAFDR